MVASRVQFPARLQTTLKTKRKWKEQKEQKETLKRPI